MSEQKTMYRVIADAIAPVIPADWEFIDFEAAEEAYPDQTTVMLSVKTIEDLPEAPLSHDRVTWVVTVTTDTTDRHTAEPKLFDQVAVFRNDLKRVGIWLGVGAATKAIASVGRLAYDIDVSTQTQKEG